MPVTLKIKVTKDILDKSKFCATQAKYAITNCAVSLAIRDIFPEAEVWSTFIRPFAGSAFFGTELTKGSKSILLPLEATLFIYTFDNYCPDKRAAMDELEFEIQIPDEIIEKINIDEIRPLLVNHPTLELVTP